MNSPLGPSMNRNDVITIVPVMSNQLLIPAIPSRYHGIDRPARKYWSRLDVALLVM